MALKQLFHCEVGSFCEVQAPVAMARQVLLLSFDTASSVATSLVGEVLYGNKIYALPNTPRA